MARERHETAFVVGAIAGGVAGAVWGLLNASVPGREARSELALQMERAADQLVIAAADFEVAARQWLGLDPAPDAAALAAAWPPAFEPPPTADGARPANPATELLATEPTAGATGAPGETDG
ncbi:MAG: hypothetical protein IT337_13005 [Thermomicrobiales bacterium]|nr:hypothetical protein [Thermomicrobiales bacterium]